MLLTLVYWTTFRNQQFRTCVASTWDCSASTSRKIVCIQSIPIHQIVPRVLQRREIRCNITVRSQVTTQIDSGPHEMFQDFQTSRKSYELRIHMSTHITNHVRDWQNDIVLANLSNCMSPHLKDQPIAGRPTQDKMAFNHSCWWFCIQGYSNVLQGHINEHKIYSAAGERELWEACFHLKKIWYTAVGACTSTVSSHTLYIRKLRNYKQKVPDNNPCTPSIFLLLYLSLYLLVFTSVHTNITTQYEICKA